MISLDTNAVIALLKDVTSPVLSRFEAAILEGVPISVSSIVIFELLFGAHKSARRERNEERIATFAKGPVQIWSFDAEDAAKAGQLRAHLKAAGTPIGPYDLLIAAQACRREAVLVTANTREFGRVPGLKVEDWTTLIA